MTEEEATAPAPKPSLTSERTTGTILIVLMLMAAVLVSRRVFDVATGPLPPGPGLAAPAFSAKKTDGGDQTLAALQGKVVLLDFWATWCPPCVASLPHLDKAHREYASQGFVVLGVNQEPDQANYVRRFIERRALSFPNVFDPGQIKRDYGVFSFPTSFLLDRSGKICEVFHGPMSEARLERAIKPLLDAPDGETGC